jgi:uncharacterized protein
MLLALEIALVAVFVIALVFSMFGQGGGSLYTPTLVLLGFAVLVSVSTSLVLNLVTAAFATAVYFRQHFVDLPLGGLLIPGSVAGAFLGGLWGNQVDTDLLLWVFVAFLAGAGARMVATYWDRGLAEKGSARVPLTLAVTAVVVFFSFGVGVLSGLLGIGGGVVLVPFLIFALRVPTKESAGTTAFVVIFSSLSGVLGHSAIGHLDLTLILATAASVAVGGFLGARLMVRARTKLVQVGFGLLLWAFAIQLVVKLLGWG